MVRSERLDLSRIHAVEGTTNHTKPTNTKGELWFLAEALASLKGDRSGHGPRLRLADSIRVHWRSFAVLTA